MKALPKLQVLGVVEVVLWSVGIVWLVFIFTLRVKASAVQKASEAIIATNSNALKKTASFAYSQVLGRLDIPAINLSVPILDNYDPSSLRSGVGHIQGSAMPGGLGNLALAGHRDTYFRPLRRIVQGMEIHVTNSDGEYQYIVDSIQIVAPQQVNVLDIGNRPSMTLITCYPFDFVGAAPKRFVVQAHLVSPEPSSTE